MSGPHSIRILAAALAFGGAAQLTAPLLAQSSPPTVDATLRNRFGFVGPTVKKVGDGLDLLRCADLDGDGKDEIIVDHSARGRLTILGLGDRDAIEEEFVDTDGTIYGLQVADVDGDGTLDFLMFNRQGRLVTRLRGEGAGARPEIEMGPRAGGDVLRVGDVDGDGAADAVVLLREGVRVVRKLRGTPELSPTIPLDYEGYNAFHLTDVDGDGKLDLVVLTTRSGMPLHVAFGTGDFSDGAPGFGAWTLFPSPWMRFVFPGVEVDGKPTLLAIQDRRSRLVEYAIRTGDAESRTAVELTSLHAVRRGAFPFAHGDLDADGDLDLVLAHPDRAELVYMLEQDGAFVVQRAPSLAGISSLALGDHDQDGKVDLILASSEEETIAWKSGAQPLEAFPTRLPTPEAPLAVTVSKATGAVYFVAKDKRRQGKLFRVDHGAEEAVAMGDLGRFSGDPARIVLADVGAGAGEELIYVVPGEGLQVAQLEGDTAKLLESGASAGFTKKIEDGAFSTVRGADDAAAIMIVRERFARVFRMDAAGEVAVDRQLNAPTDGGELALGALFADGRRIYVDRKANKLYVDRDGTAPVSVDLPPFGVTHLLEHHGAALLIGRSGVVRVPFGASRSLHELRNHEPPTDDTNYWTGITADFDGDGGADIALVDEDINGVQLLVSVADELARALGFPVFEIPDKRDEVFEPRWIRSGDWDGDGRDDLVLICHDRVLIYRQEK